MRILGIDPGSRVMGYAVVAASEGAAPELEYVECGVLTTDEGAPLERRLGELARGLTEVIRELRPEVAAMEDVFFAKNVRSLAALAQARGAAMVACDHGGLRVHAYAPAFVKQAVTGRGRATKDQVARLARALVGLRREPRPDAADALAVAIAHALCGRARALGLVPARARRVA